MAFANPFEDGTNIPAGTPFLTEFTSRVLPWYEPAKSTAPENWREKWERLRLRFERLIDEREPVECVLVQSRIPAFGNQGDAHPLQRKFHHTILSGAALRQEPAWLSGVDGSELDGAFTIVGANGEPLLNRNGKARALRFGLWRHFSVQPRDGSVQELKSLPVPGIADLARDAMSLLYDLPSDVAERIWMNWQSGFSKTENSGPSLWIDALFELSWRCEPGIALHSRPYAWRDNCSIELGGAGLFPRLPSHPFDASKSFIPQDGGYPNAFFSVLKDVSRASVSAIDEILSTSVKRVTSASKRRFRVGLSFPGEKREFIQELSKRLAAKLGKQAVLYDKFHEHEFARLNLDLYLPQLYQNECDLIVVFLCAEYAKKEWCQLEWRSIRGLISTIEETRIMLIAFENPGNLNDIGICRGDGYLQISDRGPEAICDAILLRLKSVVR